MAAGRHKERHDLMAIGAERSELEGVRWGAPVGRRPDARDGAQLDAGEGEGRRRLGRSPRARGRVHRRVVAGRGGASRTGQIGGGGAGRVAWL